MIYRERDAYDRQRNLKNVTKVLGRNQPASELEQTVALLVCSHMWNLVGHQEATRGVGHQVFDCAPRRDCTWLVMY